MAYVVNGFQILSVTVKRKTYPSYLLLGVCGKALLLTLSPLKRPSSEIPPRRCLSPLLYDVELWSRLYLITVKIRRGLGDPRNMLD